MSRVMMFAYFCDNKQAGHEPRTVEADTIMAFSPKQQQVVELEVCDDCLSALTFHEVEALADQYGREIEEPEYDPELVCPFGCNNSRPFANRGGKTRHMTVKHPEWSPEE